MWFILAISTAFLDAVKDGFGKQVLKTNDEYIVAWSLSFFSTLFLIPVLFFTGIPPLKSQFLPALIISGGCNTLTVILYIKAIKISDLSITLPMVALSPLFMLFTSPLILGEWPSFWDFIGILFLVTGSYLLNIKEKSKGYLAPFQALLRQKGPKLMLLIAFIWSISSNFDKIGLQNSSPIFWLFALFSTMTLLLLPLMLYKSPNPHRKVWAGLPILIIMGMFNALGVALQMQAFTMTLAVQVIAIKRTSVLFGVILGHVFFQEKGFRERLLGSSIMILGVLLMTL